MGDGYYQGGSSYGPYGSYENHGITYNELYDAQSGTAATRSFTNANTTAAKAAAVVSNGMSTAMKYSYNTAAGDESWGCCNDVQTNFLLTYFAYCLLGLILWKTAAGEPIHAVNRMLHDLHQGIVAYLTGGDIIDADDADDADLTNKEGTNPPIYVDGRPIQTDLDRLAPLVVSKPHRVRATMKRGCLCLVLPAGYLGTSVWAMVLVMMAGDRYCSTIMAGILIAIFILTLHRVPEPHVAAMTCMHMAVVFPVTYIEWFLYSPLLQYLISFYGVCTFIFVINDILEDSSGNSATTKHNTNTQQSRPQRRRSDSYAVYRDSWYCCLPKCVAFQWILFAILVQIIAVWLAMAEMSDECKSSGWFDCAISSRGAVDAWDGVDFEGWFSQARNATVALKDSVFENNDRR